eukprot:6848311-Heterocapsa_arctica.AAC.1
MLDQQADPEMRVPITLPFAHAPATAPPPQKARPTTGSSSKSSGQGKAKQPPATPELQKRHSW